MTDLIAELAEIIRSREREAQRLEQREQRMEQLVARVLMGADTAGLERELAIDVSLVQQAVRHPSAAEVERATSALRAALGQQAAEREMEGGARSLKPRTFENGRAVSGMGAGAERGAPVATGRFARARTVTTQRARSWQLGRALAAAVRLGDSWAGARSNTLLRSVAGACGYVAVAVAVAVALITVNSIRHAKHAERGTSEILPSTHGPVHSSIAPIAPVANGAYALHVASFREKAEADAYVEELRSRGHSAYLESAQVPKRGAFERVRIGPFATADDANAYKAKIERSEGMAATLIDLRRVPTGRLRTRLE